MSLDTLKESYGSIDAKYNENFYCHLEYTQRNLFSQQKGGNELKQNVIYFPVGYTTFSEVWLSEGMWTHKGGWAFQHTLIKA